MREKKPYIIPTKPYSLNTTPNDPKIIVLKAKENDLQMRIHNILMRVRHLHNPSLEPYPDDSKDDIH